MDDDDLLGVTRFELVTEHGRQFVSYDVRRVRLSLQDEGRTLKVFVEEDLE